MASKRSREDEKLVNATLGSDSKGIIIDTRSQTAAMNSRTKGKWKKSCIPWSACSPHPYAILANFVNKRESSENCNECKNLSNLQRIENYILQLHANLGAFV